MHVHHFVHRYPPAVGGAESYVERLGRFLVAGGDAVTVWTSTAVDLQAMTRRGFREVPATGDGPPPPPGVPATSTPGYHRSPRWGYTPANPGGVTEDSQGWRLCGTPGTGGGREPAVRRYRPLRFPGRRYLLKAASLAPVPVWQCLTRPANPTCPGMWADAGRYLGPVDAVHAFAFPHTFPAVCGLRLARRRRAPFLLTPFLHLGDPLDPDDRTRRQYTGRPLDWLLRQADCVFVQTPSEAAAVRRAGVPAGRVALQELGVDPADCTGGDRAAVRRAWGVGPGERVVGHLANNSVEKGTVDLLAAVGGRPGLRLVLAGPEMPNFRRAWERCPHKDRVVRLGVLTDGEKRDFFAGLDLFALPSRTDSFGLVLLEAWANGLPVVCYRAGGPAELVRDGIDGRVVPCGDLPGLTDAVATTPAAWGEAGRARVLADLGWERSLAVVRGRLGGPAPAPVTGR